MSGSFVLRCLFLSFAFSLLVPAMMDTAHAQPGVDVAELRDQLESGLKARRPQEFQFIARVIALVNADRLPLALVRSTFHWARKKTRFKGHTFTYFERALRIRAARIGIRI